MLYYSELGQRDNSYNTFHKLANSWMLCNQKIEGDGWHPYSLSLRIVNWIHALTYFDVELKNDKSFHEKLVRSIYGQVIFLSSNLEFDVKGNHLLSNIRALLWAGVVFKGKKPQGWYNKALRLLETEISEQVLPDGGHFERSPGYHAVVLKYCFEMAILLHRNRKCPEWLNEAIRRMCDYLTVVLPPDSQLPLLKDTSLDMAENPLDLLTAASIYFQEPRFKKTEDLGVYPFMLFENTGCEQFNKFKNTSSSIQSKPLRDSGYFVSRDDKIKDFLIFDVGKTCPDYLPAHAHADLLSYELIVNGKRIVVDSGIYEYTDGTWRNYFRSTRAHNTVEVCEKNQSEVWSSFRVARRAKILHNYWEENDDCIILQGEHDGYQRLKVPVIHRRTIVCMKNKFWIFIDQLLGEGKCSAVNNIHFHPNLTLNNTSDTEWQAEVDSLKVWISMFGHGHSHKIFGQTNPYTQGWYSEKFGQILKNCVISAKVSPRLPCIFGYCISKHKSLDTIKLNNNNSEIMIIYNNKKFTFSLTKVGGITIS